MGLEGWNCAHWIKPMFFLKGFWEALWLSWWMKTDFDWPSWGGEGAWEKKIPQGAAEKREKKVESKTVWANAGKVISFSMPCKMGYLLMVPEDDSKSFLLIWFSGNHPINSLVSVISLASFLQKFFSVGDNFVVCNQGIDDKHIISTKQSKLRLFTILTKKKEPRAKKRKEERKKKEKERKRNGTMKLISSWYRGWGSKPIERQNQEGARPWAYEQ